MAKVLVIDDEPSIREVVCSYLKHAGFQVFESSDGKTGLSLWRRELPDLLVLDLMLPDLSGEEICRQIRQTSDVPILMLTARVEEESVLKGFRLGADDYLTKPFSPRELLSRIQAILKRANPPVATRNEVRSKDGVLVLDFGRRKAFKAEDPLELTPSEWKLLEVFLRHPGQAFSRDRLADVALGEAFDGYDRTVDAHVKNLRSKIEDDPRKPRYLLTVFGFGYKWTESL